MPSPTAEQVESPWWRDPGGRVSDAILAALCLEHGIEIVSADSDFARFDEITWINPIAGPRPG